MNYFKTLLIRFLLSVLNSRFLNATPCEYGYIGNVDAFSYDNLSSEERQTPGITVKEVLAAADRFRACPIKDGLSVIENDGSCREANVWDMHDLRESFRRKE